MTIDLYERKKFNLLHFIVFFWWTALVVLFAFDHSFLDKFWEFFGVARWADLLVYLWIIFLWYLYFELLHKFSWQDKKITELSRTFALENTQWKLQWNKSIVFIIPCYWEDFTAITTIINVINQWYKVVCIDDKNNSVALGYELEEEITNWNCVLITHPLNMWQGASLQTWAEYVLSNIDECNLVVHFDADWQHRVEDITNYLTAFKSDSSIEIVLWSRFLGNSNMSFWRKLHKKCQLIFMKIFVWIKLTDTNNWYRVIKRDILPRVKITLNWMAHASEIEHIIKKEWLNYVEVPVTINYTKYSIQKGQSLWNARVIFKRLIWKWFFSK